MRAEDFFNIIDGIDDDIILDIPELNTEKPIRLAAEPRKTPIWAMALLAACFVLILVMGIFVAAKLQSNSIIDPSSYNPAESDQSSDSSDNSDSSGSYSDEDEYVLDEDVLKSVRLINPRYDLPSHSSLGDIEELLSVYPTGGDPLTISGIYAVDTGVVIWARNNSYDHYFWLDKNNVETDHVAFNISGQKELIPNRVYPNGGYFRSTFEDGTSELLYYRSGSLVSAVPLPEVHRASLTPDNKQYLCIDTERENLILHDLETGAAVRSLTAKDFGLNDNWVFEFVNVVTPKLATVTLLEADPNKASEYNGSENLHSYLLELPSLRIIQQLPDGTELTAIDDEHFLMNSRFGVSGKSREFTRAKMENGQLVDLKDRIAFDDRWQADNSSNIILSPSKNVVLLRYWGNTGYLEIRTYSTDTLQPLWDITIWSGETIPSGFLTPAAITDDAVVYLFGNTLISEDAQPLYTIYYGDISTPPSQDDSPAEKYSIKGGIVWSFSEDNEGYPKLTENIGNGTQAELDRLKELLLSPDLYSINAYIFGYANAYGNKKLMSDKQAEEIIDLLLTASISTRPPFDQENPSLGGLDYVKGYDKDGNILFVAINSDRFSIRFRDGIDCEFECPEFYSKLWDILDLTADYPHVSGNTRVKGGFIINADTDTEEYPNPLVHKGNGTQTELDRLRELLKSTELYRINGYIAHEDVTINMSDRQAQDIVDCLIDAPISIIPPDVQEDPQAWASCYVKGYDSKGNFLFEVIDRGIYSVRFQDGTRYDFHFDNNGKAFYDILAEQN